MNAVAPRLKTREEILHALYEAAELEHNLMCTPSTAVPVIRMWRIGGTERLGAEVHVAEYTGDPGVNVQGGLPIRVASEPVALGRSCDAAGVEGPGESRLHADGIREVGDRLVVLLQAQLHDAPVIQ